jgi:putative transposase
VFALIAAEKAGTPVGTWCRVLGVSRSGYYAAQRRPPSARLRAQRRLVLQVHAVHRASGETYGSPRVQRALRADGWCVGRHRIMRVMRAAHLRGRPRRRFVVTTDSRHAAVIAPNRVQRRFQVGRLNQIWGADVTAMATGSGWLYLAVVLDLCSRRVIGWATSGRLDTALVHTALQRAVAQRQPPRGVIHHSDRGSVYASAAYQHALRAAQLQPSMSRRGDCWDNAPVESFFSTLKRELVHHVHWATREHATDALARYLEGFYNRRRLHSALNYQSPVAFEQARGSGRSRGRQERVHRSLENAHRAFPTAPTGIIHV